jgi:hypothetical protein
MDIAAVLVGFAGVPQVDLLACDTGGLPIAAISGKDLSVENVGHALVLR